jgi:hypothetical protein
MGWGDEIMLTARARRMQSRDPRPVVVRDRSGMARWHPIWENNPRILKPGAHYSPRRVQYLDEYPGRRPYLDYKKFRNGDRSMPYVYTRVPRRAGRDLSLERGESARRDRARPRHRRAEYQGQGLAE